MKNILKKSLPLLSLLFIAVGMAGCYKVSEFDNLSNPGDGDVTITVSIPGQKTPSTRSIAGADGEAKVSEVDILVFKAGANSTDPDILTQHVQGMNVTQSTSSSDRYKVEFKAKLVANSNVVRVVVIANAHNEVATAISAAGGVNTAEKDDILTALKYASINSSGMPNDWKWNTTNATNYSPIPMYGEEAVSGITAGMKIEDIELVRMLARIDVNNTAIGFTLQDIYVVNYHTEGYIAPAWNVDGTLLTTLPIAPMIPTSATAQTGTANAMTYSYADTGNGNGMEGEIYTYESVKATGNEADNSRINATCLIFKGTYNSEEYYYRFDFTDARDAAGKQPGEVGYVTPNPALVQYMPIYRNHKYLVNITRVDGIGYKNIDDALKSMSITSNLKTTLHVIDDSKIGDLVFDGQHYLGVGDPVEIVKSGSVTSIPVITNYAYGWEIDDEKYTNGIEYIGSTTGWLTASKASNGSGIEVSVSSLPSSVPDNAVIHLKAGRLRHIATVKANYSWARSNIVWIEDNSYPDGGYLTFAVTSADNITIPANSQGLLFQWGSLVAISPASLSGTTATYTAKKYPNGHIVYSSTGTYTYAYTSIPYINEITTPFNNTSKTDDDFSTYNGNTGFNASIGKGDICRYITSKGWVDGNWRLPTQSEYDQLLAEKTSLSNGGSFTDKIVAPNTTKNHHGFYQPLSGRWLGIGATSSGNQTNPSIGVYFPASGYRYTDGYARVAGQVGYVYSGSSNSTDKACYTQFSSGSSDYNYGGRRQAFPIRCIRE
ncbi:fimbrial protein [Bacteroides sp. 224]|uniref:fimbrial protein n=1 Tax=Bacteroides sp. 224 TaxID=2302936 RepID=UPI0013D11FF8|nr:fimbrial protein [Bacteroides sp. 224]NDV67127.1 hypothetical protein [Bacteroides sp. 224]